MIDAHQHFWWLDRRPHRWPDAVGDRLHRDFTPEDLVPEMAASGVTGTILMQSLNDAQETIEYLELAARTPWIRGVVGWVPLDDPAATETALANLRGFSKLVGIRHLINFEPDPAWLLAPQVQAAIDVVAARGLVFDAVPNDPARFAAVIATAERRPGMQVVLDHLCRPPIGGDTREWAMLIDRAAALPNVAIKLSVGLDVVMNWRWSQDQLQPFADHALDRFGPHRVMAASNWPVARLAGAYSQIWRGIESIVARHDPSFLPAVMGGTASRLFGLPPCSAAVSPSLTLQI